MIEAIGALTALLIWTLFWRLAVGCWPWQSPWKKG